MKRINVKEHQTRPRQNRLKGDVQIKRSTIDAFETKLHKLPNFVSGIFYAEVTTGDVKKAKQSPK